MGVVGGERVEPISDKKIVVLHITVQVFGGWTKEGN
jgi:hypothetical protein